MRASRLSISILCVLISACGAARPIKYYTLEIPSAPPSPAGTGFAVSLQVGNIEDVARKKLHPWQLSILKTS